MASASLPELSFSTPAALLRVVLLKDKRLDPLLKYFAEPEHLIGAINILTAAEVTAFPPYSITRQERGVDGGVCGATKYRAAGF